MLPSSTFRRLVTSASASICILLLAHGAAAQFGPTGVDLTPRYEATGALPGSTARVAIEVELDPGYHVNSEAPLDPFLIPTELVLGPPEGITVERLAYPESFIFDQAGLELVVFGEQFAIGVELALADTLAPGEYNVPANLRYQACDDTTCYSPDKAEFEFVLTVLTPGSTVRPVDAFVFDGMVFDDDPIEPDPDDFWFGENADGAAGGGDTDIGVTAVSDADLIARLDDFEVMGTSGGYMGADDFLEFIENAESGEGNRGFFEGRGPLAIIALTLLGGLALNLTPCVLPMIPINLAIIGAGSTAGSRARGFALGGVYGLAMAAVYGVLGLVVILTAGTFGTINASPWFNLGIAVLFVVLALAMFDKFIIDFSSLQSKLTFGGESGKGSFFVAFGMGSVAALLAGACVAPVVIQVIVFSSNLYATGTTEALALPFFLGVGMALPWPIAGAGLSALPKPGAWMNKVKYAFGVFILATAGYYGYLSYELFAQYWVDPDEVAGSVEELLEEGWHASLAAGLEEAMAENKPVLVDMWATWCKNCLVMDQTTLKDPAVVAALEDYVKVKYQAEDLNAPPARDVAKRFEAIGLPAYAIIRPASSR